MPTPGPCANPKCSDKWNASGQFTRLDEEFVAEHFDEIDRDLEDPAHCGKRPCRRWCGKLGPIGGSAQGGSAQVVAGAVVAEHDVGPRPAIIDTIVDIWAERCVRTASRHCLLLRARALVRAADHPLVCVAGASTSR